MRYQGGKSRIAKPISEKIMASHRGGAFVSLFCGSCAVESKIKGFERIILNDKHKYLISLLKGVQQGYVLPDTITEEQYKYIRSHKDEDPVLTGFVGFGCSFGGRWFQGYARCKKGRNYAASAKNTLLRDLSELKDAEFLCQDYRDVEIPKGAVIYADPPYQNTKGYMREKFDSEGFWEYARTISKNHLMFISEQTAPDDFIPVWKKTVTRTLDVNKQNQPKVEEMLFIHKSQMIQ